MPFLDRLFGKSETKSISLTDPDRDQMRLIADNKEALGIAGLIQEKVDKTFRPHGPNVSVRCRRSDEGNPQLIVSTIDSGHLEALHGGQEGSEEAVLG